MRNEEKRTATITYGRHGYEIHLGFNGSSMYMGFKKRRHTAEIIAQTWLEYGKSIMETML